MTKLNIIVSFYITKVTKILQENISISTFRGKKRKQKSYCNNASVINYLRIFFWKFPAVKYQTIPYMKLLSSSVPARV